MVKKILFIAFLVFAFTGCELEDFTIPFNFGKDAPSWLKIKVASLTDTGMYVYMQVYRYEWNDKYVYNITSPFNSCIFCDMYDDAGNNLIFSTNEMFLDFLYNKKNETLIWEWKL